MALRILFTVHAVVVIAQPMTAGMYMGGDYGALDLHHQGADMVSYTAALPLVLAIALVVMRGPRWPLVGSVLLTAGEALQYRAGKEGPLALHIPLGSALMTGAVVLCLVLWRASATERARRERPRAEETDGRPAGEQPITTGAADV